MNFIGANGPTRLRAALRAAAPAVWDWDALHQSFLVSDGFRVLYGIEPSKRFGVEDFVQSASEEDRPRWRELFRGENLSDTEGEISYRFRRSDTGEFRWASATLAIAEVGGKLASITATLADVTEQRQAALALVESEERLRLAIEAGRMAVWEVDLETGRLTNSPQLNLLLGFPIDARPTLADVRALYAPGELERLQREGVTYERVRELAPADTDAGHRDWRTAAAVERRGIQAEFSLISPDGTHKQLILRAQHAPAIAGMRQRLTGILVDITDRKRSEERVAMVARELQHRVKNSLMVVRSLAVQAFREGNDRGSALEAFTGRLAALAAATDTILDGKSDSAVLDDVIERIVRPYRSDSNNPFRISGPTIEVPAKLTTAIGMAIHELATNALKYGALSVSTGSVSIAWQVTQNMLELEWRESGGPEVRVPARTGFGSRLLQTIIPDGSVSIDYAPAGVVCHIHCSIGSSDRLEEEDL